MNPSCIFTLKKYKNNTNKPFIMKLTSLFLSIALLGSTCCCQAPSGSRIEQLADDIEEWAEDFEDSMEDFTDEMEDFADEMDDLAENVGSDSTLVIQNNGGVVTYYKWQNKNKGNGIHISKKDRYLTRKFDIGAFRGLDVNHSFEVVMCDTIDKIIVRINEKLDKHLNVRLNKGTLVVKLDNLKDITMDNDAKCGYIYLPYNLKLSSISLSGTSTFYTALPVKSPVFSIEQSGATACTMKKGVVCNNLEIDLSGTSVCKGNFVCKNSSVDMSGATIFGGTLKATDAEIDLSGVSRIKAKINTAKLEADLGGASNITLKGTATDMEISLSGTSHLDCEGLSAISICGEMSGASSASVNASQSIAVELSGTSSMTYSGQADISRSSASRLASIKRETE